MLAFMLTDHREAREDVPGARRKPSPLTPGAAFSADPPLLTMLAGRVPKGASAKVVAREVQLRRIASEQA